jgi:hypothetical protein
VLYIFIEFLVERLGVPHDKVTINLYLHSYHDIDKAKEWWSNKLGIPLVQFKYLYVKPDGSRKYKDYNGIATARICNTELKQQILGMIDRLAKERYNAVGP